ncbi:MULTISPECIES: hypothetical protein [Sphingomonas]|uniref:Uncharacterized protein n=1 Tax=Sphingomonas molluscorum TaxID=418184 RepID=A0ABU8Q780_9SPHN|nr:hypothetical protein [Sphingomonas sp. JUb134]MBM7406936.1 hypothetical protein [Sphingomonas sp. JUb134]
MPQASARADKPRLGDAAARGQPAMDGFAAAALVLAQGTSRAEAATFGDQKYGGLV